MDDSHMGFLYIRPRRQQRVPTQDVRLSCVNCPWSFRCPTAQASKRFLCAACESRVDQPAPPPPEGAQS